MLHHMNISQVTLQAPLQEPFTPPTPPTMKSNLSNTPQPALMILHRSSFLLLLYFLLWLTPRDGVAPDTRPPNLTPKSSHELTWVSSTDDLRVAKRAAYGATTPLDIESNAFLGMCPPQANRGKKYWHTQCTEVGCTCEMRIYPTPPLYNCPKYQLWQAASKGTFPLCPTCCAIALFL